MMIHVTETEEGDPLAFDVAVRNDGGETRHAVSLARGDLERLAGDASPAALIEAAFRFLLDREPKEAILRRFDISVIGRYFPEFERELPRYLAGR